MFVVFWINWSSFLFCWGMVGGGKGLEVNDYVTSYKLHAMP